MPVAAGEGWSRNDLGVIGVPVVNPLPLAYRRAVLSPLQGVGLRDSADVSWLVSLVGGEDCGGWLSLVPASVVGSLVVVVPKVFG